MSDAHEAMQVFLATQQRVDEVFTSVQSLAGQVELIGARMDDRLKAMDDRLSTLEGKKKGAALAVGAGGVGGAVGTFVGSGGLDAVIAIARRLIP
jgi:hypothetical protein